MKYGIKVPIALDNHGEHTDWLWVTKGDSKFQLAPLLFEIKQEAVDYALNVWGETAIVEEYGESKNCN